MVRFALTSINGVRGVRGATGETPLQEDLSPGHLDRPRPIRPMVHYLGRASFFIFRPIDVLRCSPMLFTIGYVEYEPESGVATRTPTFSRVALLPTASYW